MDLLLSYDIVHQPDKKSPSFKFKTNIACRIGSGGTKKFQIRVPLKYLSCFWKAFEMSLITFEINFILPWSARRIIINNPIAGQEPTITGTKLYAAVVTLQTQDNAKPQN